MGAALKGPFGPVPLGSSVITIGRAPDNQLALQDPQASSHHAEIRPEGPAYSIIDRGSTNGTFVNEQRIAPQMPRTLNTGDRIRIGSTVFTYEMDGAEAFAATTIAEPVPGQEMAGGATYGNYGQWQPQAGIAGSSPQNSPYAPPQSPPPQAPAFPQQPPAFPQQPDSYAPAPGYPQQPGYPNYQQPPAFPQQPPAFPQQPGYPNYGQPPAFPQQPGYPNYGQPPAFPQQPGFLPPAPQTPQPKKSSAGLIVVLVVLAVLIVGGLGFFVLRGHGSPTSKTPTTGSTSTTSSAPTATPTPVSTPQQTLTTYCNAIKSGDYNTAYNQFSSGMHSKETEQQYAAGVTKATAQAGKPTDCTYSNVQTNGNTGTATLNLSFANVPAPVNAKINLVKENGVWKMNGGAVQQTQP